jgi:hypothetical protein
MRSPFRTIVSGLAILPLIVVTPDSSAYLYKNGHPTTQHNAASPPSANISNKKKGKKNEEKKPHIILDRAIPEFSRDDLKYLPVEPATFGHGRIGIPIGRDLAQAGVRGCRRRGGCGHGIRHHRGEEHATKDVSELVRGRHEDEWEMDFVRVEGKDG